MPSRLFLLAALASLSALVSAASAQVPAVPPPGAGPVPGAAGAGAMAPPADRAQIAPWADRLFARLDTDQNDMLTGGELMVLTQGGAAAMGGGRLRAMIAQSDTSRDSRISREEMAAGALRLFDRMDANGDGRLTGSELPQRPEPMRVPSMPVEPAPDPFPPMPEGD